MITLHQFLDLDLLTSDNDQLGPFGSLRLPCLYMSSDDSSFTCTLVFWLMMKCILKLHLILMNRILLNFLTNAFLLPWTKICDENSNVDNSLAIFITKLRKIIFVYMINHVGLYKFMFSFLFFIYIITYIHSKNFNCLWWIYWNSFIKQKIQYICSFLMFSLMKQSTIIESSKSW